MPVPELVLSQMVAGPVEAVYNAWTDPVVLARWFGPTDAAAPEAELDVRPGGNYRITMLSYEGDRRLGITGTYREVDPPRRLVFTWRWEGGDPHDFETLVTVELRPRDGGTELTLTHGGFPDELAGASYGEGWDFTLPRLAGLFG